MDLWNFEKYADLPAVLTEEGKGYCYAEIDLLQQEFASQIRSRALVLLATDNDLGSLIGYLSCLINDNVPILLPQEKDSTNFFQL